MNGISVILGALTLSLALSGTALASANDCSSLYEGQVLKPQRRLCNNLHALINGNGDQTGLIANTIENAEDVPEEDVAYMVDYLQAEEVILAMGDQALIDALGVGGPPCPCWNGVAELNEVSPTSDYEGMVEVSQVQCPLQLGVPGVFVDGSSGVVWFMQFLGDTPKCGWRDTVLPMTHVLDKIETSPEETTQCEADIKASALYGYLCGP
jgi:hypothetical protein